MCCAMSFRALRPAHAGFGRADLPRCSERQDHLHDLVHDHHGRCRLVLAVRRICGAMDRGDPSAQHMAQRLPAFGGAGAAELEEVHSLPFRSVPSANM